MTNIDKIMRRSVKFLYPLDYCYLFFFLVWLSESGI